MFYLAQISIGNIGTNPPSLLGIIQIVFGFFYVTFLIIKLKRIWNGISSLARMLYIIQLVFFPIFMLSSGLILMVNGWRLDPFLQFQQFILSAIVFYFGLKDVVFKGAQRNR